MRTSTSPRLLLRGGGGHALNNSATLYTTLCLNMECFLLNSSRGDTVKVSTSYRLAIDRHSNCFRATTSHASKRRI